MLMFLRHSETEVKGRLESCRRRLQMKANEQTVLCCVLIRFNLTKCKTAATTASSHPLKIGHIFIFIYRLKIVVLLLFIDFYLALGNSQAASGQRVVNFMRIILPGKIKLETGEKLLDYDLENQFDNVLFTSAEQQTTVN